MITANSFWLMMQMKNRHIITSTITRFSYDTYELHTEDLLSPSQNRKKPILHVEII